MKPTDYVPMFEAKKVWINVIVVVFTHGLNNVPHVCYIHQIESPVPRVLAMWLASYYHALRPRLLVPISLAALMAAYNSVADVPLTGFQEVGEEC